MVGGVCSECKNLKETETREKHFAKLRELPIEERIRQIEEWQYDYRPQHVPPPRF